MSQNTRGERARKAAEAKAAQERREKLRRNLNIGGVVLVVLLVVVGAFLVSRMTGGGQSGGDVAAPEAGATDYGVTIGPETAPHQVVIYEDFVPLLRELEKATSEELATLAADGKVYVDYRPFQLFGDIDYSAEALNAFKVVRDEAGPVAAKTFHDELYADQPDERGPYPDADALVDLAVTAGASESDVRPGIEDMSQQAWVDEATQAATDAGVESTPTILLDGKPFTDGSSVDELATNLLAALD